MMDFKNYVTAAEKQYRLRLKTVVVLDDAAMDAIEVAVAKHLPLELSSPKKTIMQANPIGFTGIPAAEVYIVDMVFGLPVSADTLRNDIRMALKAPEPYVVVRYPNDALEIEGERVQAAAEIDAARRTKGQRYGAILDTGVEFPEAEEPNAAELYGDAYNATFLSYVNKVQKDREDHQVKAANAPFIWLDVPDRTKQEPVQDDTDFNKDIKGAPKVKPGKSIPKSMTQDPSGSVDDRKKLTRLLKDKNGNRVVASAMMGKGE